MPPPTMELSHECLSVPTVKESKNRSLYLYDKIDTQQQVAISFQFLFLASIQLRPDVPVLSIKNSSSCSQMLCPHLEPRES